MSDLQKAGAAAGTVVAGFGAGIATGTISIATGTSAVAGTTGTLLAIAVGPSATATGSVALAAGVGATASGTMFGLAVASLAPVALPFLGVLAVIGGTAYAANYFEGKSDSSPKMK